MDRDPVATALELHARLRRSPHAPERAAWAAALRALLAELTPEERRAYAEARRRWSPPPATPAA